MKVRIFQENADDMEGAVQAFLDSEKPSFCQGTIAVDPGGDLVAMVFYKPPGEVTKPSHNHGGPPEKGPSCKLCGAPMIKRFRHRDNQPFWGCSSFPTCKSIEQYNGPIDHGESNDDKGEDWGGGEGLGGDDIPF